MRQKRIDSEQRAELTASKPAAAIEGLRPFTGKQGQYLAFIYYYSKIHGMPPAEADFQRYFRVTSSWPRWLAFVPTTRQQVPADRSAVGGIPVRVPGERHCHATDTR